MIGKVPSKDFQKQPEEPKKLEEPTTRPKATFHWPPDCLWPFIDHGWEDDT
jgi:hypothetical protein